MIRKKFQKKSNAVKVTFILPDDHPYGDISVVGDFNEWNPESHPFIRRSNETCSSAITLDGGERFRFRYFSRDGQWINDDAADGYEENSFGTTDCILLT